LQLTLPYYQTHSRARRFKVYDITEEQGFVKGDVPYLHRFKGISSKIKGLGVLEPEKRSRVLYIHKL